MANLKYRYFLQTPLSLAEQAEVWQIPGLFVKERLVVAPLHAAWFVEQILKGMGKPFSMQAPSPGRVFTMDDVRAIPELREWTADYLAAFQREGILFAINGPDESGILSHPTGAGKSLEGIVWGLLNPGTVIFVTKAGARRTIQLETERYTTVRPRVLWPPSDRRFVEHQYADLHKERIVIVGWESLPLVLEHLLAACAPTLVLDELHNGQGNKRWEAIPGRDAEGNDTKTFKRLENRVACAARLAANAKRRLGLTATFIPDRVRNMWGELDLIWPRSWGTHWGKLLPIDEAGTEEVRVNSFAKRYCDLTLNDFGGWDDRGSSNRKELKQRLSYVVHRVDSSITHRDLPPKRRQIVYLTKSDQNAPSGFTEELRRAQQRGTKSLQEVKLAEAASRKRTYVIDTVLEAINSKQKVVIFTGRHKDCERLEDAIRKAVKGRCPIYMAHGGHGTQARDEIRETWMGNPAKGIEPLSGPAVLIGTAQAWGEAYSINHTHLALMVMLPINARELWQREGRFYRQGQKVEVLIQYVIAEGTYDEHVASILLSKLPAVADIQADSQFQEATAQFIGSDRASDIEQRLLDAVMQDPEELFREYEQSPPDLEGDHHEDLR